MLNYGTRGDGRIMDLMAQLYGHNLESSRKQMQWYESYQLPYEKDFWELSQQYLPDLMRIQLETQKAQLDRMRNPRQPAVDPRAYEEAAKRSTENQLLKLQLAAQRQLNQPTVEYQLAQMKNQMEMLPHLHAFGLEGIEAQRELLPYNTEAQRGDALYRSGLAAMNLDLLPYQHEASMLDSRLKSARSESGLRLNPYEESAQLSALLYNRDFSDMNRRMLPFAEESMESGLRLEGEQNQAARFLLPGQTMLTAEDIAMQRALIPDRQYTQHQFYRQANEGVDPNEWAARAAVDMGAAYSGSDGALRRDAARMGVDPASGRFANAQGGYGLNMARDLAQAATLGRRAGEDENWKRLATAAQMAKY